MSSGNYDTRAPSASSQIITLERLLEEAEERNAELRAAIKTLHKCFRELEPTPSKEVEAAFALREMK